MIAFLVAAPVVAAAGSANATEREAPTVQSSCWRIAPVEFSELAEVHSGRIRLTPRAGFCSVARDPALVIWLVPTLGAVVLDLESEMRVDEPVEAGAFAHQAPSLGFGFPLPRLDPTLRGLDGAPTLRGPDGALERDGPFDEFGAVSPPALPLARENGEDSRRLTSAWWTRPHALLNRVYDTLVRLPR